MKAVTSEWLSRAADDLKAAEVLTAQPDLTNVVAFHAQQAVEKALKAVVEEQELGRMKTHSLTRLYEMVEPFFPEIVDWDMLDRLEAVYVEARYPGDLGLLPYGKPDRDEAVAFYEFAARVVGAIRTGLEQQPAVTAADEDTDGPDLAAAA
jgi:HEPN domain-containing protein